MDAETFMVKELLTEMEEFSPVGSTILNRTGVQFRSDFMNELLTLHVSADRV